MSYPLRAQDLKARFRNQIRIRAAKTEQAKSYIKYLDIVTAHHPMSIADCQYLYTFAIAGVVALVTGVFWVCDPVRGPVRDPVTSYYNCYN